MYLLVKRRCAWSSGHTDGAFDNAHESQVDRSIAVAISEPLWSYLFQFSLSYPMMRAFPFIISSEEQPQHLHRRYRLEKLRAKQLAVGLYLVSLQRSWAWI